MLPFTIPSKMQKPWENASFTVMHQSWENCAIVTQALDKRKLRMTNWKALIQFKLLQHLAYTEVKKVLQHFITLLNDEKVLILRAKHNLLIDWYTRSRLEKNLSITLVLTVWMCNLFKKIYCHFYDFITVQKKVEITLYLKVSFLHNLSNPKIVC